MQHQIIVGQLSIVPFENTVIISRVFSALFSSLLLILIYKISRLLHLNTFISVVLVTFSIGLFEYAHFGTFELWLTFFNISFLFITLLKTASQKHLILSAIIMECLLQLKYPLVLFPLLLFSIILVQKHHIHKRKLFFYCKSLIQVFCISFIAFSAWSPYFYLDFHDFSSIVQYESSVALVQLQHFIRKFSKYTSSFLPIH